jgi:hypothetical protein
LASGASDTHHHVAMTVEQIKELRIENCNKIASKDFPLAKIIAACPNLEELTYYTTASARIMF